MEMANLEPVTFKGRQNKSYNNYNENNSVGNGWQDWQEKYLRNFRLGISAIVLGYFTFIFYILTIYGGSRFMQQGMELYAYVMAGAFFMLTLASGILLMICLVLNIRQSRAFGKITKGLILTLISMPPVVLCYAGLFLKAISGDH
jgi:hypothetical protein